MKWILLSFFSVFYYFPLNAQENFNSAGHDKQDGNLSISYSIGQTFIDPFSTYGGLVNINPGIQQARSTFLLNNFKQQDFKTNNINLYPNPIVDRFILSIPDIILKDTKLILYNIYGIILEIYPINSCRTNIEMTNYPSGIYLLKVINDNEEIKFFKVIKN